MDKRCFSTRGPAPVAEPHAGNASAIEGDSSEPPAVAFDGAGDPPTPLLVPLEVSRAKLADELAAWAKNAEVYRRRGWLLLHQADLEVHVGFVAQVAIGDLQAPIITAAIKLRYDNYDLWPPSLTFIDPLNAQPKVPTVSAVERNEAGEVRNVLLGHPITQQPFLCLPGLREYHEHPQHSGDDWLLHRNAGEGRLAVVCDRVWRRMVRNVLGLQVQLLSLPGVGTQLQIALAQGDIDASGPLAADPT
jgi:hypothetical protein